MLRYLVPLKYHHKRLNMQLSHGCHTGMTLIEVIVAIAIIGIMSVGLLTAFASNHSLLSATEDITSEVFSAQNTLEDKIETVKYHIANEPAIPTGPAVPPTLASESIISVFGVDVISYRTQAMLPDGTTYTAYVGKERAEDFVVPEITSLSLKPYRGGVERANAYPLADMSLQALADTTAPVKLHYWYVSRPGYWNAFPTDLSVISDEEIGLMYPRFPEDYEIIPGARSSALNDLTDYAGRYIIYTVTPASAEGKMGDTVESDPVYVSGLPYVEYLALHLDASAIDLTDTAQTRVVSSGSETRYFLKKWENTFSEYAPGLPFAEQNTESLQPQILDVGPRLFTDSDSGNVFSTDSRYVQFTGTQLLEVADAGALDSRNMVIFVAMKGDIAPEAGFSPRPIVSRYFSSDSDAHSWYAGWLEHNGLGYTMADGGTSNTVMFVDEAGNASGEGLDDNWHVLRMMSGILYDSDMPMKLVLDDFTGDDQLVSLERTALDISGTNNPGSLLIGGSIRDGHDNVVVDVAEILIYYFDGSETDEYEELVGRSDEITAYLMQKHMPVAPDVFIYKLLNDTRNAMQGEPFTLPSTVTANMTDGTRQAQEVTWLPAAVSTANEGTINITGRSVVDPSKTMTLAVTVSGVAEVLNPTVDVEADSEAEPYQLPGKASAKLNNGVEMLVDVVWKQEDAVIESLSIENPGVFTVTGQTQTTIVREVTFTLNVLPAPTDLTITPDTLELAVGVQSQPLVSAQVPEGSMLYPIVWSSSDPDIATISTEGVVMGVAVGEATITATIAHEGGDITGECVVTVVAAPEP